MAVEHAEQVPHALDVAEQVAAVAVLGDNRSVLRSPLPPMRIGMSPRSGFGLLSAPWTLWWVPSTVARSSVNMARAIRSASSRRSKRSFSGGKSMP